MSVASNPPDETAIVAAFERGDFHASATFALEAYGDEILRFLAAYLRNDDDAREVFASFAESFWRGLPRFEWRTTLRAWAYTLARHAAIRHKTAPQRKPGRNIPLSELKHLSKLVETVRTRTALHLRTETKNKMRMLRQQLSPDDQTIIILRVDRGMSWRELAEVMHPERSEPVSGSDSSRAEARLRKRFQLAKNRLKQLARNAGLVE